MIEARWSRGRRIDLASCDWLNAICFLINFLTMGCWLLRYLLSFQRRTMNYSIYGPSCGNFFFGRNDFHQRPRSLCNIHFSLHSNCNSIKKKWASTVPSFIRDGYNKIFHPPFPIFLALHPNLSFNSASTFCFSIRLCLIYVKPHFQRSYLKNLLRKLTRY